MKSLSRRKMIAAFAGTALLSRVMNAATGELPWFDVRDFGAIQDGVQVCTAAIQKAIDTCSAGGGGTVLFARGRYVSGTLFLKSNVTLRLEAGAVLSGSPNIQDYAEGTGRNMYANEPQMNRCLIFARDAINIGIQGMGTIDGQGKNFPNAGDVAKNRPMMLRLINCQNISLRDVTFQNPAAWTSAFLYCSDVKVDGINISSRARGNGDGLDFDGCQDIRISNCRLDNSDDSICLQSSDPSKTVRNVVITNCLMTSRWAAIRIGLLSRGVFQDITVSNCVFHEIEGEAIKIQLAEGGQMDNFLFSNIVMRDVPRPVLITLNSFPFLVDAPGTPPPIGTLKNITFTDMRIESGSKAVDSANSFFAVLGLPDHPVEEIHFSNITFLAPGGGSQKESERRSVPELDGIRPERKALGGPLPSFGIFARHVKGLSATNISFQSVMPDSRPGIFCDDVQDLRLSGANLGNGSPSQALIVLRDVTVAIIQASAPLESTSTFLYVEGRRSSRIAVLDNDLRLAKHTFRQAVEVAKNAVTARGNLTGSLK